MKRIQLPFPSKLAKGHAYPIDADCWFLPKLGRIFETFSKVNCRFHCFVILTKCI